MLSKEEIENLLKDISQGFRKIPQVENILYPLDINQFKKLSEYIKQLKSDKQKLIEKLKEDIKENQINYKTNTDGLEDYWRGCIDIETEILETLKGEKE